MGVTRRWRVFWGVVLALFFAVPAFALPLKKNRPEYVEGEVLVLLKNNTLERKLTARSVERGGGRSYANSVAAKAGARAERTYGALSAQAGEIFVLVKSDVKTTEELIAQLEKDPNVISAAPNYIFYGADKVPNDPDYSALWGMTKVNAPAAWEKVTGGDDVYVAVLDTGLDYNHPDLSANAEAGLGVDFTDSSAGFMDVHGHGSHVSGTIGAVGDNGIGVAGINWSTKIIPLKVLGDDSYGTGEWIAAGVNKVVEYLNDNPGMRIPVANLSIIGWWDLTPQQVAAQNEPYWRAFKTLSDMNTTVIVVCAGNDSKEVGRSDSHGRYPYPASFIGIDNMIVVGAIDSANKAASFTNWSATLVDLVAPGVAVRSTLPGNNYALRNGTSMATPHVAGAAALLASYRPDLEAPELKALLLGTANPDINPILNNPYNPTQQTVSRYGLLDVGAAVEAATLAISIPVTGVSISPAAPDPLYTNDETQKTVTLTAEVLPGNATLKTLQWTTDDSAIATVAKQSGVVTVTAVGKGTARIRAAARDGSGVSADVSVEVKTYAAEVALDRSSVTLAPGATVTLVPTVSPPEASQEVSWSITPVTGNSIRLENGVVSADTTAVSGDKSQVTVTAQGSKTAESVTATATVTVEVPLIPVETVTVSPKSLFLQRGVTGQLSAQVAPENATDKSVVWNSDKTAVAAVNNSSGLVTAVAAGTAVIKAQAFGGKEDTSTVTVTNPPVPVSGIALDRYQLNLAAGTSYQLTATVAPPNADNKGVSWSTADAAVAGVSQNGSVSAFAAGTTTITAKAAGDQTKTAQATVKVTGSAYVPVTKLTLTPDGLSLKAGDSALVTVAVAPSNASNTAVSWESSQPAVATVTQDGHVTAVSAGKTNVTAKALGGTDVSATILVEVTSGPFVAVGEISADPASLTMKPQEKKTIEAALSPDDATNKEVVWESSNPAVATVEAETANVSAAAVGSLSGRASVTAVSFGHAVITVTALGGNNVKTEIPVTVENDTPVGAPTLPPGNITVGFIGSPTGSQGVPFTSSVQTSAPAANVVLLITYPDGSVHYCETRLEGSTLVFTFTPPMAGTYRLDFTLIDADGKLSEPSLELRVSDSSGPVPVIPDPVVPTPTPTPTPTPSPTPGSRQGSGGGGCDSGMGALAMGALPLLLAGAFFYRRK